jgi:L,D-peptidoglycan transpeptidase YkuD (ErfK/YbiS/YcfS/YnhG family)
MRDQRAYIVVETIGSFMMFVLLVTSILSLVNIVTLQARLHYALTQSATALAIYSSALEMTGAADHLSGGPPPRRVVAAEFQDNLTALLSGLENLAPGAAGRQGPAAYHRAESGPAGPQEIIRLLLEYGLDESNSAALTAQLIRPLMGRYLANGALDGEAYLRSVHVVGGLDGLAFYGFDLPDPSGAPGLLIDGNGDIRLAVRYDIDYSFGALPLPFRPRLSVTQTAKTKAWLGGSGERYAK